MDHQLMNIKQPHTILDFFAQQARRNAQIYPGAARELAYNTLRTAPPRNLSGMRSLFPAPMFEPTDNESSNDEQDNTFALNP
jgi:hypothetical protein